MSFASIRKCCELQLQQLFKTKCIIPVSVFSYDYVSICICANGKENSVTKLYNIHII